MNEAWTTGSGQHVAFNDMMQLLHDRSAASSKVYVGTDSQVHGDLCEFSTAIVLYSEHEQKGGQYFYLRRTFPRSDFKELAFRISTEVQYSVELACRMHSIVPNMNIEIHVDTSPPARGTKTSKLSDSLIGYAVGMGFDCKIKPDAWAASNIADKHAK